MDNCTFAQLEKGAPRAPHEFGWDGSKSGSALGKFDFSAFTNECKWFHESKEKVRL